MSNTPTVRKIVDLDTVLADMRARLDVVEGDTLHTRDVSDPVRVVLEDQARILNTLEAAVAEIRRVLAQAEPASKDLADMRGAEWALKCVRGEIRAALRGE